LTKEEHDETINGPIKEAHMSKMAQKHAPNVASIDCHGMECEIVYE